tara:strand:+ start:7519 stop:7959 length:441 start_codon:yes stop_codon:yes gene_type:complete
MRTSEIKSKIVSAIEAITPDKQASARDTFRHVDHQGRFNQTANQAGRLPDRVFHVAIASVPTRADFLTVDAYNVDYAVTLFYSAGQAFVEDRIAHDVEAIDQALTLTHREHADLFNLTTTPGGVDEFENHIEVELSTRALYRLTGV